MNEKGGGGYKWKPVCGVMVVNLCESDQLCVLKKYIYFDITSNDVGE